MKLAHRDCLIEIVKGPETGFLEVAKDNRSEQTISCMCPGINRSILTKPHNSVTRRVNLSFEQLISANTTSLKKLLIADLFSI